MLKGLVYYSTATKDFSREQLENLLEVCHANNRLAEITGILVLVERNFFQYIEGEEEQIDKLYKRIKADRRHRDAHCIFQSPISERTFPNWEMGFYCFDHPEYDSKNLYGYISIDGIIERIKARRLDPSIPDRLIEAFLVGTGRLRSRVIGDPSLSASAPH